MVHEPKLFVLDLSDKSKTEERQDRRDDEDGECKKNDKNIIRGKNAI